MGTPSQLPPLPHFHPRCKVCDYGDLLPKKIFRMSGPVVAIGFILLIPSVLGMIAAGLMFFGVIAASGIGLSHNTNTSADIEFRRACINVPESDTAVPITQREQYCECTLIEYKATNSVPHAREVCSRRLQGNMLADVDEETHHLYTSLVGFDSPRNNVAADTSIFGLGILGSTFAIALGIASFVGGLLGWLLVMKKRVLQCSTCGATVSAS
jgi:hypothetical protein